MKTKDLVKGKSYMYIGWDEPVEVQFLYETLNGLLFTDGRTENELSRLSVELFIHEIKKA